MPLGTSASAAGQEVETGIDPSSHFQTLFWRSEVERIGVDGRRAFDDPPARRGRVPEAQPVHLWIGRLEVVGIEAAYVEAYDPTELHQRGLRIARGALEHGLDVAPASTFDARAVPTPGLTAPPLLVAVAAEAIDLCALTKEIGCEDVAVEDRGDVHWSMGTTPRTGPSRPKAAATDCSTGC